MKNSEKQTKKVDKKNKRQNENKMTKKRREEQIMNFVSQNL